jgi:hypothetical protein
LVGIAWWLMAMKDGYASVVGVFDFVSRKDRKK